MRDEHLGKRRFFVIRRRMALKDLETGLTLATFDCYHNSSKDGPDWVKALEPL